MRKRAEEIGVRKAFGASTANLMLQVLVENFVQMLLGGAIGLLLSYGMFQVVRSALLANLNSLFQGGGYEGISMLSFWHVIDLTTVGYVFVICFVLNLVSTLLPGMEICPRAHCGCLKQKMIMLSHILKLIANQWKSNLWILAELFISFVCLFLVFLFVARLIGRDVMDKGFDIEHVYKVSWSLREVKGDYTSRASDTAADLAELVNRLRRYSGVEAVGLTDNYAFPIREVQTVRHFIVIRCVLTMSTGGV